MTESFERYTTHLPRSSYTLLAWPCYYPVGVGWLGSKHQQIVLFLPPSLISLMLSVKQKNERRKTLFLPLFFSFASGQQQQQTKRGETEPAKIPGEMQRVRNCITVLHQVLLIIRRGPDGGAVLMLPLWPCLQTRGSADRLSRVRREAAYNNYTGRLHVGGVHGNWTTLLYVPPPLHNWMLAMYTGPVPDEPYFMHGLIVDCWSFLYTAILRSRTDSLRSHVILHEWLCVCVHACVRARISVYVCVSARVGERETNRSTEVAKACQLKKRHNKKRPPKKDRSCKSLPARRMLQCGPRPRTPGIASLRCRISVWERNKDWTRCTFWWSLDV